jgi:segregation and condensation protein A
VARFLALLELFREGAVSFDQVTPLGELTVRWTGADDGEVTITDEFDGSPEETGAEETEDTGDGSEDDRERDGHDDVPVDEERE